MINHMGIQNRIDSLEKMGYDVMNNKRSGYIHVILKTKSGYDSHMTVFYEELEKDFSVEKIVYSFNKVIAREL